ncbi:hypothetical protein LTR56_014680 [Elasticomyces elasticus]|nr:hypothetical protein LTR56_014680 [Elasticomyces elasticus]KAK3636799.1 hypothetical protein LTR22_018552 [Elasticomyces elasticus]KAK4912503.1 hypothetical protein LTR49_019047 [Elasticomyces elasticus]KAK5751869.1 hypothetical protein LTS12_018047 [Elasticomyces elasticus]
MPHSSCFIGRQSPYSERLDRIEDEEQEGLLARHDVFKGDSNQDDLELIQLQHDEAHDVSSLTIQLGGPRWDIHKLRKREYRSFRRRIARAYLVVVTLIFCMLMTCAIFFPSYLDPTQHYGALSVDNETYQQGSANAEIQKVFIVASLIALDDFRRIVGCNASIVVEELDVSQLTHVNNTDEERKLKRVGFLAETRNRALRHSTNPTSPVSQTRFDRLLYVNDVVFDPFDAANLLFSTNVDGATGMMQYRAACATDSINPSKFYDTFATRDLDGYSMGVLFSPRFSNAGHGASRQGVLAQKDAVRVKSWWGVLVACEAR